MPSPDVVYFAYWAALLGGISLIIIAIVMSWVERLLNMAKVWVFGGGVACLMAVLIPASVLNYSNIEVELKDVKLKLEKTTEETKEAKKDAAAARTTVEDLRSQTHSLLVNNGKILEQLEKQSSTLTNLELAKNWVTNFPKGVSTDAVSNGQLKSEWQKLDPVAVKALFGTEEGGFFVYVPKKPIGVPNDVSNTLGGDGDHKKIIPSKPEGG